MLQLLFDIYLIVSIVAGFVGFFILYVTMMKLYMKNAIFTCPTCRKEFSPVKFKLFRCSRSGPCTVVCPHCGTKDELTPHNFR